jgi:hypothetical protein
MLFAGTIIADLPPPQIVPTLCVGMQPGTLCVPVAPQFVGGTSIPALNLY